MGTFSRQSFIQPLEISSKQSISKRQFKESTGTVPGKTFEARSLRYRNTDAKIGNQQHIVIIQSQKPMLRSRMTFLKNGSGSDLFKKHWSRAYLNAPLH